VAGDGGLALGVCSYRTGRGRLVLSQWGLTAASALAAIVLAIGIAATLERYFSGMLMGQVAARALDHVELGVAPHVSARDFEPPYTLEKLNDIDDRVDVLLARALEDGSGILRLGLYSRDGTILYSDLASLRGQAVSVLSDSLIRGALAGSPGAAFVSLDGPLTGDLLPDYSSALEACVPIILNGEVVGVYDLYQDPALLYALRPPVWGFAAIVALAFFALLRVTPRPLLRPRKTPAVRPRRPKEATLTRREMQVLALLAHGGTYRTIGDQLVISEETVRTHVKSILHKLGEPTRVDAVAAARRAGLIAD
jgi:DNA-binding CsgD family transcriptional regulator